MLRSGGSRGCSSLCSVDRYGDLLHCSHMCVGKCTYIPIAVSNTKLAAFMPITFISQAEKEPKSSEWTADFINHTIITSGSITRITTVGMTLTIRPPIVVVRNLQYMLHSISNAMKANTEHPKHTTATGIECR